MSAQYPLASIIIPVYNAEKDLPRCLDSILNQTMNDFELFLINDGSKDSSAAICRQYEQIDDRIRFFDQINQGVSVARNVGLDNALGEYIVFVDSDDWLEPEFISAYIDSQQVQPVDLVYQGFINEFQENSIKQLLPLKIDSPVTETLLVVETQNCLGGACNKLFKRSIIENYHIRFNPAISYGEDKIFALEYCQYISSISLLDTAYYHYNRSTEDSLSKKHHTSEEFLILAESEYKLFLEINQKYPNDKFLKAIKGSYITNNKYALLSLYRPEMLKSKRERLKQLKKIAGLQRTLDYDRAFDRHTPKFLNSIIRFQLDSVLLALLYLRTNFSVLYTKLK
ncbi:MAG: glycosyltransferase family 2 protein [Candidatus Symbiothrix sp.]|jgi:glycosyltransferase involved in cell wall biosynthesis|nr:glycosyltransferase family 2 protein [Candidatus Symbiothrix sp.]